MSGGDDVLSATDEGGGVLFSGGNVLPHRQQCRRVLPSGGDAPSTTSYGDSSDEDSSEYGISDDDGGDGETLPRLDPSKFDMLLDKRAPISAAIAARKRARKTIEPKPEPDSTDEGLSEGLQYV
eukprot:SAG11_NODE_1591_length_4618_cov_3.431069_1_plen_124_part_00